ncbi:MAG: DNA-processing protein DprA [Candidatus Nealsonbacteria bacterium]|nr:DNA-processing protein DprA [Candidatus Nealsonbacteria bacterium]
MEEIKKISFEDKNYPNLLKKIQKPPKELYLKGNILSDELCFAIVGTRRFSSYGKQVAWDMAGDLSESGLTIVSGLAPGIDTFAHSSVIERNKRTIAVLGTGLDEKSIYPQSNLRLAKKIIEKGGTLLSEYPPGTRGTRFTFPQRNRIISGLSLGVLVIEAKEKSGSLITANCAFSQKRKVFAVPGSIYSSNSQGCHYLIKKGAKLIQTSQDILQELNLSGKKNKEKLMGENEEENIILKTLLEGSLHIDEIIKKAKLQTSIVNKTLTILEIKNKIRNLGGNIYAINNR